MVRFGYIIGCALVAAGAGLGVYGSPYYMLDWGGTLVISGVTMVACGVVVLMLAAVLTQLRAIALRLDATRDAARSAPATPDVRVDPPLENGPARASSERAPDEPAPTIMAPAASAVAQPAVAAVGAAVAAGGLATAAASILSSVSHGADQGDGADQAPPRVTGRDDLFGKVEQAVRALKDEAAEPQAPAQEDFADLRADLLPSPATDGAANHADDDGADVIGEPDADGEPAETVKTPDATAAPAAAAEAPASAPPVSEEGVVAAYTVGDTSYTMFANGRIRADTPDGELNFDSMDELKEHMARRRLGG